MRLRHVACSIVLAVSAVGCGSSSEGGAPADGGSFDLDAFLAALDGFPPDLGDAGTGSDAIPGAVAVELAASSTEVVAPGSITLTATAMGNTTIGKIEFYEQDTLTLLGTKNASPATITLDFVEGDNGTHGYIAKAYTPTSSGTSALLSVHVAIPGDPCGVDKSACVGAGCTPGSCLYPTHLSSGFGAWSRSRGVHDVTFTGATAFDTLTGAVGGQRTANIDPTIYEVNGGIGFVRVTQPGSEPPLAVWVFQAVTFNGAVVTFTSDAAPVLAAARDATIATGTLFDVGAKGRVPGPGGFLGGTYAANGLGCAYGQGSAAGGGGAGFGTDGARGGSGAGGLASNCAGGYGTLLSLRGGSGAGGGDDSSSAMDVRFGGAGGGALQISALGNLKFDGIVTAAGGGGRTSEGNWRSGAGGGSGGAIFLESPSISLGASAGLYANGGGGGSTSPGTGGACGSPGGSEDGQASLIPAKGSHCGSGYGGDGAAAMTAAMAGSGNGGGGGGLGRIVLNTLKGATPSIATPNLSPGPSSGGAYVVVNTLGP